MRSEYAPGDLFFAEFHNGGGLLYLVVKVHEDSAELAACMYDTTRKAWNPTEIYTFRAWKSSRALSYIGNCSVSVEEIYDYCISVVPNSARGGYVYG